MIDRKGKMALVTGGGGGIGAAIVLGERACAVVTLNEGSRPIALDDVVAHLAALQMSKTYFPERRMVVDALPKTISVKSQKFTLREMLAR